MQSRAGSVPPELAQPTPRPVAPTGGYYQGLLYGLAICVLPFCGVALMTAWTAHRMQQLHAHGQYTPGVVTRLYTTMRRSTTTDHVAYDYRALDGQAFEDNVAVPPPLFRSLYPGEPLRVFYLPEDEAYSTLAFVLRTTWRQPWRHFCAQMLVLAPVSGGLLIFVLAILYCRYRKECRLVRWGVAVPATLIDQRRGSGFLGGRWRIECTFQTEAGASMRATSFRFAPAEVGQPLWALYDPQQPYRCMIYPAALARIADDTTRQA